MSANGPRLEVACFGVFRVAAQHGWESGPAPKRGRELIQYLSLYPKRSVSRERLCELFWAEVDLDVVQHRLHIAASGARTFLRKVLGGLDAIRCTPEGYGWNPTVEIVSDVASFTELYRDGSPQSLKAAAALYAGELFEGEEGDWLEPERTKYSAMHTSIVERLANAAMADGDFESALNYGLELLVIDRAHEGAARLVMRCFAASGRRGRAMAEYEILRKYLQKHLAIEPMAETTDLIRSILGRECIRGEDEIAARV